MTAPIVLFAGNPNSGKTTLLDPSWLGGTRQGRQLPGRRGSKHPAGGVTLPDGVDATSSRRPSGWLATFTRPARPSRSRPSSPPGEGAARASGDRVRRGRDEPASGALLRDPAPPDSGVRPRRGLRRDRHEARAAGLEINRAALEDALGVRSSSSRCTQGRGRGQHFHEGDGERPRRDGASRPCRTLRRRNEDVAVEAVPGRRRRGRPTRAQQAPPARAVGVALAGRRRARRRPSPGFARR